MWVTKLLISQVKKKDFLPKNDHIWPKIGTFGQFGPGHAGLFGALLVGRLQVVARAVSRKTPIYFISYYEKSATIAGVTIGSDTSCTTFTILGRICRVAIGPNHISLVGANLAKGANFSAAPNPPPVGTQPNNKPNHLQKLTKQRRNFKHLPSPSQLKWWDGNVVIAAIFHHT